MSIPKQGDTVFVIATCADAWKRGSGICYFYENGGCPYQTSGRLEHCGEREDVLDVFTVKVELVEHNAILLQGITFGFSILCESVSKRYIGKRIFTDRADAVAALERMEQKRERKRQERRERAKLIDGQCGGCSRGYDMDNQAKERLLAAVETIKSFCDCMNCTECPFNRRDTIGIGTHCAFYRSPAAWYIKDMKRWLDNEQTDGK